MLKPLVNLPLGTDLLSGVENFLTDLSVEDEALITGGNRSNSNTRSRRRRPRPRRPRPRRSRT